VTLEPNPEWAAPDGVSPTLDSITIRFIDDLSVAANAFRTGELQGTDVDLTQLASLRDEFGEDEEYFKFLAASTRGLQFQHADATLADFNVRLALSRAIDREALVEVAAQGGNAPTTSWIPETVAGGAAPDAYEDVIGFDPDAARAALAAAGYEGGAGFPPVSILISDTPTNNAVAQFLQQSFSTVLGINIDIEVVDGSTRAQRYTSQQFQLFWGGWVQDYPDPENWVLGLYDTGGSLNNGNCSDPDIDALVDLAAFNSDNDERVDQYSQINDLISEHLCNIAPAWHEYNHWLVSDELIGLAENQTVQDAAMAGDWNAEAWGFAQ
jgi:oligopeptide transport system substrate-binding protein